MNNITTKFVKGTVVLSNVKHDCHDLMAIFNDCFIADYQTQLVKGEDEPIYLPAHKEELLHTIFFAYGYFSSALHECSHWFIAGEGRRQLVDFGYWYEPDGRTAEQQKQFQQVEVKPQALEWILSVASNYRFQFSIDNLNGELADTDEFKQAVYEQVLIYCEKGLPRRAYLFREALCRFYGTSVEISKEHFVL